MQKIALITGASSGIGYATAKYFAENNINLIICGRREDRLNKLKREIDGKVKTEMLIFDVSRQQEVFEKINNLSEEWKNIDFLINNAGNAHGMELVQDASLEDWEKMIDINVKGLMYVTKAVLPFMLKRKTGHIVNIGSVAGKEVYLKGSMYCASKHAVDAFNDGLRMDLSGSGIKVSSIHPGAVNTEFSLVRFKGDKKRADSVYEGFTPLYANDIADLIYYVVSRPAHVNIADTLIFPANQSNATTIYKSLQK
jgi:3-hydroxy acid dehydrogenase / malonic semialdehyde reductase